MGKQMMGDYLTIEGGLCLFCKHLRDSRIDHYLNCNAFPDGIPYYMIYIDHRKPFPGDNGIQFELMDGQTLPDWAIEDAEKTDERFRKIELENNNPYNQFKPQPPKEARENDEV